MMLSTPGGNPAFTDKIPNSSAVIGVNSDGFKITEQPKQQLQKPYE